MTWALQLKMTWVTCERGRKRARQTQLKHRTRKSPQEPPPTVAGKTEGQNVFICKKIANHHRASSDKYKLFVSH